ncbi:MGMT family protein [Vibrio rumoiensis]|uniref:MGMT family protein n=1 Tax=Vibrio rumoiensis TaxID=76258 RepID=A0ABW7IUY7_9VIBR|nr:MGMT family protein [Vibrio rumoiensis]
MTSFEEHIFYTLNQVPYGKVSTYGMIAKAAGYPGYARHVGRLLANLPEGSKLPWYRVINSQGKISLKGNDMERQKAKLLMEGVDVSSSGRINLKKYLWQS